MKKLKVILKKSPIDKIKLHKKTLKALGLLKVGSSAILPDNKAVRGMIEQVGYMLSVQELTDAAE